MGSSRPCNTFPKLVYWALCHKKGGGVFTAPRRQPARHHFMHPIDMAKNRRVAGASSNCFLLAVGLCFASQKDR